VIVQVLSSNAGKGIPHAPIHHHFELKDGTRKIVVRFWIISIILVCGLSTLKLR